MASSMSARSSTSSPTKAGSRCTTSTRDAATSTIVVGPGGIFTVETKTQRGKVAADRIDERALAQAYAEAKYLEAVVGQTVSPLLVFSRAYIIGRPVTQQRGVCVLPARMLAGHLARRPLRLSPEQVRELHHRLAAAL